MSSSNRAQKGGFSRWRSAAVTLTFALGALVGAESGKAESAREESHLSRLVVEKLLVGQARVQGIADPMRIEGAALCGDRLTPVLGIFALDRRSFSDFYEWYYGEHEVLEPLFEAANEQFALGRRPTVIHVVPNLAADRAGLRVGDIITEVDGREVKRHLRLERWGNRNPDRKKLDLRIERDGVALDTQVDVDWGCAFPARYHSDASWNAFAASFGDLTGIYVHEGLLRASPSDDEVAVVIGHEFAHLVLANGSTKRTEAEADYLGLYFAARAGFDITRAPGIWEERIRNNPYQSVDRGYSSHPQSANRAAELFHTMQEIREKEERGEPLEPEEGRWELDRPKVNRQDVTNLAWGLSGQAVERFREDQQRVANISYPLAVAGAPFCPRNTAPLLGAAIGSLRDFSPSRSAKTATAFDIVADGVVVFAVAPDSPADVAGIQHGDVIRRVNGKKIKEAKQAFEALRRSQSGQPKLKIERDEEELEVNLPRVEGCAFGVLLFPGHHINPHHHRNKKEIIAHTGLLRFADNDDEVALELAHQIGHQALSSFRTLKDEVRADEIGLQIAMRAGFDISGAPAYWTRKASVQFWQIPGDTGGQYIPHGALARRLPSIREWIKDWLEPAETALPDQAMRP